MYLKLSAIIITGFFASLAASSCSMVGHSDRAGVVNMRINHFKQTGFGAFPQLVYNVQEANMVGGEHWNYFYDEIEGFEFEPGYVCDILVRKQIVKNPAQDASEYKYILQNVISKEKLDGDKTFDIRLKWGGYNFVDGSSSEDYSLMQEFNINCADLCEDLSAKLENSDEVTGTFLHGVNGELNLTSIQ